jgi:hypothetical protein
MNLQTKVGLLAQCTLPESGFPIDELALSIKTAFDTEGLPGVVRVMVAFVDVQVVERVKEKPDQFFARFKLKPCCKSPIKFYRVKQDKKTLKSVIGRLKIFLTRIRCCHCGTTLVPMRSFLKIDRYQSKTKEFEKKALETVSEQSYRKSADDIARYAGSEISKSQLHSWVMKTEGTRIKMTRKDLLAIIADGSGYKRFESKERKSSTYPVLTSQG